MGQSQDKKKNPWKKIYFNFNCLVKILQIDNCKIKEVEKLPTSEKAATFCKK